MAERDLRSLRLALFTDTYAPQINGVARTLERLVGAVRERGGDARVFTTQDPDARVSADTDVIRYSSVPFWAYDQFQLAWPSRAKVATQVADFSPTLVHAATPFGIGLAGRRAALQLNVPLVTSYHTSFTQYAKFYHLGAISKPGWKYLRWFHNSGLRTYCPTQSIVDEVNAQGFANTHVWSRGVDAERFSPVFRSEDIRARLNADDDALVVTYVGRLAEEKGLDVAVNALRLAEAARPGKIRFICVGDGPYEARVREHAPRQSWLPGKLTGTALSKAYASGDVFLFPSTTDTFGNVLLEAMASGLSVLGADVGPTRELIGNDRGWLAQPGNAQSFADALVALIDNRELLTRARERALAFAVSRTWANVWDLLFADYCALQKV